MRYFNVNVQDRLTDECVCVGSMLNITEVEELIHVLEKYNASDLLISKEDCPV